MPTPAQPLHGASAGAADPVEGARADGSNSRAHEFTRAIRRRTARVGRQSAEARLNAADERDLLANARDLAAPSRDGASDAIGLRIAGAADREQAARERLHALVDREILADELAIADNDPLTGARTRAAGMTDLEHEIARCRRTSGALVVAYLDIVGLKTLNDSLGHEAGDDLLKRVVRVVKQRLRPYDLVIRLGGDEFLCAMSSMTLLDARRRFSVIAGELTAASPKAAIRTGFATLAPGDGVTELMARADSEMIDGRHSGHVPRIGALAGWQRRPNERVAARPESVATLRRAVVEFAAGGGASERQCEDIAVAVSEALNNAVVHAYADRAEPGTVALDAWMSERALEVVVRDEGAGLLARATAPTPGSGLGLALIVRMTQKLEIEEAAPGVRLRMMFAIG